MLGKFIAHCEDSLTASVFTHLLHLPAELFWQIMREACYTNQLPTFPGEPTLIAPWPSWDAEQTGNTHRVVPDFFLRFPKIDLIIEAKRRDDGMQNSGQWNDQVAAYRNEYGTENVEVRMIALGGVWSHEDDEVRIPKSKDDRLQPIICPIHMCRWSRLLNEVQRMERELARRKAPSSQDRAHQRILADLIKLFGCHGFQTGKWFNDLVPKLPRLASVIERHRNIFRNISSRLKLLSP